jgi:hypothetical protein
MAPDLPVLRDPAAARNVGVPPEHRIELRMAIHVDDVMIDEGVLSGC